MIARTVLTTVCDRCEKEHQVAVAGLSLLFSLPYNWAELQIKEHKHFSSSPSTIHLCPDCTKELWDEFLTNKKAAQSDGLLPGGGGGGGR